MLINKDTELGQLRAEVERSTSAISNMQTAEHSTITLLKQERDQWRQCADEVMDQRDRLKSLAERLASALESSNKTLMYIQEEYASGNGVRLIYETVTFNKDKLADWARFKGE